MNRQLLGALSRRVRDGGVRLLVLVALFGSTARPTAGQGPGEPPVSPGSGTEEGADGSGEDPLAGPGSGERARPIPARPLPEAAAAAGASPDASSGGSPSMEQGRARPTGARRKHPHARPAAGGPRFESAVTCARCHDQIYDEWQLSMHAQSWTDPVFQAAYARALKDTGGAARETCLGCHAPVALLTGDTDVSRPVSREGITCDLCHSISGVSQSFFTAPHYFTRPGAMLGPSRDAHAQAPHPTSFSELQTQSLFCAACHQAKLHKDDAHFTFDTYREWETSPYNRLSGETRESYGRAEVITRCQDCHMKGRTGRSAKDGPIRAQVHRHFFPGGNAPTMVGTAVRFFMSVRRSADRRSFDVTTQVQNRAAGHMMPTDLPDRRLVVEVRGFDADHRVVFRDERVYGKVLEDARGRTPARFWLATGVARDNRIAPGEIRSENFRFYAPGGGARVVQARLLYYLFAPELAGVYGLPAEPLVVDEREETFGR